MALRVCFQHDHHVWESLKPGNKSCYSSMSRLEGRKMGGYGNDGPMSHTFDCADAVLERLEEEALSFIGLASDEAETCDLRM